jgi:DNA polymerase delta subunit 3
MLFEFHRQQNVKKPGSVHATYIVAGSKRNSVAATNNGSSTMKDGEDEYMQRSPFRSSPIPPNQDVIVEDSPILSITLVREEDLEGMKVLSAAIATKSDSFSEVRSQYEVETSIHVYSLAPSPLKVRFTMTVITDSKLKFSRIYKYCQMQLERQQR